MIVITLEIVGLLQVDLLIMSKEYYYHYRLGVSFGRVGSSYGPPPE